MRLDLPGTVAVATADDYPGVGSRTAADDGHFVQVKTTLLTQEPGKVTLLSAGLLLVATGARARRAGPGPGARRSEPALRLRNQGTP